MQCIAFAEEHAKQLKILRCQPYAAESDTRVQEMRSAACVQRRWWSELYRSVKSMPNRSITQTKAKLQTNGRHNPPPAVCVGNAIIG